MKRRYDLYLRDILESITDINEFIQHLSLEEFKENKQIIAAVEMNFIIIAEAIGHIPKPVRATHADIPWQRVKNFRNVLVHKYHQVQKDMMWDIIKKELPPLSKKITQMLNEL